VLFFAVVFAARLAVFGSGKFGWSVVALGLAGEIYRYVFFR
jgi:hypothetical protein